MCTAICYDEELSTYEGIRDNTPCLCLTYNSVPMTYKSISYATHFANGHSIAVQIPLQASIAALAS